MKKLGVTTIIMEVSSHALELSKVEPIKFDIGIFTGLSHEHLEFHGRMENYFLAKKRLMEKAKGLIINYDDPKIPVILNIKTDEIVYKEEAE